MLSNTYIFETADSLLKSNGFIHVDLGKSSKKYYAWAKEVKPWRRIIISAREHLHWVSFSSMLGTEAIKSNDWDRIKGINIIKQKTDTFIQHDLSILLDGVFLPLNVIHNVAEYVNDTLENKVFKYQGAYLQYKDIRVLRNCLLDFGWESSDSIPKDLTVSKQVDNITCTFSLHQITLANKDVNKSICLDTDILTTANNGMLYFVDLVNAVRKWEFSDELKNIFKLRL